MVAVILFMLFGVLSLVVKANWIAVPQYVAYATGTAVLIFLFVSDRIAEKTGVWR